MSEQRCATSPTVVDVAVTPPYPVRSASSVPPALSHCVYVMTPGSPSTLLAETQSSTLPASRPCTRNFAMNDMSITITPSRAARCSSAQ